LVNRNIKKKIKIFFLFSSLFFPFYWYYVFGPRNRYFPSQVEHDISETASELCRDKGAWQGTRQRAQTREPPHYSEA
jgi:hypothetical protein